MQRSQESSSTILSSYFTDGANAGQRGKGTTLFKEKCFEGEGRSIHVLAFYDFTNEGGDFGFVVDALKRTGVAVHLHVIGRNSMPDLRDLLKNSQKTTLWVIGGSGGGNMTAEHVAEIVRFHRGGGGLSLWGDNHPYFHEPNLVMRELGWGSMEGNYHGDKTVGAMTEHGEPGFNGPHPILCGIQRLYEGITVAGIPEDLLSRQGWVPIMRATDKRLLTAYLEPCDAHGPVVLHGAFTQLFCKITEAEGQADFIRNLGTYTVLRNGDTSGSAATVT
jgi:hypothetical protein